MQSEQGQGNRKGSSEKLRKLNEAQESSPEASAPAEEAMQVLVLTIVSTCADVFQSTPPLHTSGFRFRSQVRATRSSQPLTNCPFVAYCAYIAHESRRRGTLCSAETLSERYTSAKHGYR